MILATIDPPIVIGMVLAAATAATASCNVRLGSGCMGTMSVTTIANRIAPASLNDRSTT